MARRRCSQPSRRHVQSTPTPNARITEVEGFFALLTDDQIRRSAHRSPTGPEAAIKACFDSHSADPESFRSTKIANDNLAAIQRVCQRTTNVETGWLENTA